MKLNAAKLKTLTKPGSYGDGDGLYIQVRSAENRSWVFRYKVAKRGRLMGLGSFPDVGLAEARELAQAARKLRRNGVDPIDARPATRTGSR